MKHIKLFLTVGLALLCFGMSAQDHVSHRQYEDNRIYSEAAREKSILTRGVIAPDYPFVHNGTWYAETREFLPGEVLYNNRLYRGVLLNIDACRNLLVVNTGIVTATDRNFVDYAIIDGQKYVNLCYRDRVKDAPEGFCKLVFDDDRLCFYSLVKKTIHNSPGYHNGDDIGYVDLNYRNAVLVGTRTVNIDTYFAYSKKHYVVRNGVCYAVKSRAGLLKMFDKPTAKKLRKWASENNLNDYSVSLESYAAAVLSHWRANGGEGLK